MGEIISSEVDEKTGEVVDTKEEINYDKPPETVEPEPEVPDPEKPEETPSGDEPAPAPDTPGAEPDKEPEKEPEKPAETETPEDGDKTPEELEAEKQAKEAAEAEAETEETPEKPKKKGRMERRVDKLTRDNSILEEENVRLRAGQQPAPAAPVATDIGEPPKEADFDNWNDFNRAETAYEVKKGIAEDREQQAQVAGEAQNREIFSRHQQRVEVARGNHEDWDEVAQQAQFPVPAGVQLYIMQDDAGAEILYHLAKNPEVSRKLSQMPDVLAIAEVGKIAASLAGDSKTAPVPTGKPVSTAPKPRKPVGGGATKNKLPLDDPRVSQAEYDRRRSAGEV